MPRFNESRYRSQLSVAMVAYMAAMLLVWPLSRTAASVPLKVVLAVVPVLPMLFVIGLMARRIGTSDEFEQRVHLVALGASTALLGALSLVGGFLAAAGVLRLDGSILIWVFPVTMIGYGIARWWLLVRHYGGSATCEGGSMGWRLVLLAVLVLMVLGVAWWRGRLDDFEAGLLVGLLPGVLIVLAVLLWRRLRRRPGED
ncbi:hypothetical protein LQ772_00600 [Frateuria edaphi]|jgi:hypothetical protein|uniref:hypothetical protein n=1 Tax=Frateuria edaphi TaxID=2898793 RepID=UPI001E589595|nr:hypothetical protein [Frateuria edaphi]UGB45834.1 hypothetical protein LQ772_00600 [Frateuria edaphi]